MGKGGRSTRREKRKGEGRGMRKSFSMLLNSPTLAGEPVAVKAARRVRERAVGNVSARRTRLPPISPKEHPACISRKSEKDRREGKSLFRGVAGAVYRDSDQTHREETGGGGDTQADVGNTGASTAAAVHDRRMQRVQYVLDRTLQWHHAGTSGCSHAQMSPCRSSSCYVRNRHVLDWMHLQFLLPASRIEQNHALWMRLYPCNGCRID